MADDGTRVVHHGAMDGRSIPRGGPSDRPAVDTGSDPGAHDSPWRAGIATGVGSMPGSDPVDAAALIAGELPDLPHLVELPQRGAGADMIGRTVALLVDMPAEVVPTGWRLTRRPGRDVRRAADFLAWDADAAEQHFAGARWIKVQVAGPWTLAAQLETPSGNRAVLDAGAVTELAASLAEGLAAHLADLSRRLPGTGLVVQIDEPSLPAVLAGTLRTASGFGTVSAVEEARVLEILTGVTAALGDRPAVAHCCHPEVPIGLLRQAGFAALSFDVTAIGGSAARLDSVGEAVEAGAVLLAGLVPTGEPGGPAWRDVPGGQAAPDAGGSEPDRALDFHAVVAPLLDLWHRLGLPTSRLGGVVVTPTCGLGGTSPRWARRALALARDAGRLLAERAEQD